MATHGEAITNLEGVVQAVLPGAWAPSNPAAAEHRRHRRRLPRRRRDVAGAARTNPLRWAALVAAVPVLTLAVTYAQVARFQIDMAWAAAALALTAALIGTTWLAVQAADRQRAGVHAAGSVAALALACAMLLHDHWLTLAVSFLLPALA